MISPSEMGPRETKDEQGFHPDGINEKKRFYPS